MRLSEIFGASAPDKADDAAGVTIDVMTGIVAGLAFVLGMLILATALKEPRSAPMPSAIGQEITRG